MLLSDEAAPGTSSLAEHPLAEQPGPGAHSLSTHSLTDVLAAILPGEHFLVTAHARPDGDAIGSMLACSMLLAALGKTADLVSSDGVPQLYTFLPHAGSIQHRASVDRHYDAVILLECDNIARAHLGGLEGQYLINIDHHASGRAFAAINWIDPAATSVGEMIFLLARHAGIPISPELATCLYTALLTDTGRFCYSATNAQTFAHANEMVERGADPAAIAEHVYFSNRAPKMMLLGAALSSLRMEGPLAWMQLTHDDMERTGAVDEDCEGLVNYAIGIAGVEVAVLLREMESHSGESPPVRLSLRSKGERDVAAVAASLGGGGHIHASGCTLAGPMARATRQILQILGV